MIGTKNSRHDKPSKAAHHYQDSDELARIHPKLGREIYRSHLQESLTSRLLALGDEGEDAMRPALLIGNSLVDPETGEVLEAKPGENPAMYVAAMHALAADPAFRWVGYRQGSDVRGEEAAVPLGGTVWCVSDQLDPDYNSRKRVKARKQIREGLRLAWALLRAAHLVVKDYRERFLTLTLPHRDSATRMGDWATFNGAFERLRETELWQLLVWGGFKNIEDPGIEAPHVHAHLIAIAKFIGQLSLAWVWTGAVVEQFRSEGDQVEDPRQHWVDQGWDLERIKKVESELSWARKKLKKSPFGDEGRYYQMRKDQAEWMLKQIRHDLFMVDIQLITDRDSDSTKKREGKDGAIDECAKYVTKHTDLLKFRKDDLLGLALACRAPRVFDGFGKCWGGHEPEEGLKEDLDAAMAGAANADPASLDTAAIVSPALDGTEPKTAPGEPPVPAKKPDPPPKKPRPPSWRVLMMTLNLEDFIKVMRARAHGSAKHAFYRLGQAGIIAWTVKEVLEMGECPVPF